MFGWEDASSATLRAAARWRTSRRSGSPASSESRRRRARLVAGALHARPHQRRARAALRERSPATHAAAWTSKRSSAARGGGVGTVVATLGTTAAGSVDPLPEILKLRERYGFRLHADCAYGGYYVLADNLAPPGTRGLRPPRRGRLDRHRPAQARPAALRLRLRAVSRSRGRPLLPARLALHLFQLEGAAPRRDQPRVLAARRRGGRALGDAAAPAARARRRIRSGCCTTAARPRSSSMRA